MTDLPDAGLGLRAAARLADVVLVMVPAWLVLAPLLILAFGSSRPASLGAVALAWAVTVGYETWLTTATGQTVGKRAVGIRVVDRATARPPRNQASFRRAALPPVLGTVLPGLGWFLPYLWAVWDPSRRGLHDRVAGTIVVRMAPDLSR